MEVLEYLERNHPNYFYRDNILDLVPLSWFDLFSYDIYITSQKTSHDWRLLVKNNIKTVICINTKRKPASILSRYEKNGIKEYQFEIEDDEKSDITSILFETFEILREKLQESNVLVHCQCGISRSTTCILYYLVNSRIFPDLLSAIKYMRKCRPSTDPNKGFIQTLIKNLPEKNS